MDDNVLSQVAFLDADLDDLTRAVDVLEQYRSYEQGDIAIVLGMAVGYLRGRLADKLKRRLELDPVRPEVLEIRHRKR